MSSASDVTTIVVNLDENSAEWLAARIDDARPTLADVATNLLRNATLAMQDQLGCRPCRCEALERLADEPNSPVRFDCLTNEYTLVRNTPHGQAEHQIRYCVWCGGKAPESKRDQLFAKLEREEVSRLTALCTSIQTFEDAIAAFGVPTSDRVDGLITISKTETDAKEWAPRRVLTYDQLSETAEVRFTQRVGNLVSVGFVGKYIGRQEV